MNLRNYLFQLIFFGYFFCGANTQSHSQFLEPFPIKNVEYRYLFSQYDIGSKQATIYSDQDTLLDGELYSVFVSEGFEDYGIWEEADALIRYDSVERIYYMRYRSQGDLEYTEEQVLYNLDEMIEESYFPEIWFDNRQCKDSIFDFYNQINCIGDEIWSVDIGTFRYTSYFGSFFSPLHYPYYCEETDYFLELQCIRQNNIVIYPDTCEFNDCELLISTSDISKPNIDIQIFPNPTDYKFNILNSENMNFRYQIYTANGELQGRGMLYQGVNSVEVELGGIYFITINSNLQSYTFKILVQ